MIYNTMWSKVDGLAVREDFLSKSAWKSPILAARFLDHLTLEGASTHNFKDWDLFRMCFGKFGTRAFRWAMGRPSSIKIVRLAAIWNFSWGGNGKLQKTAFFAKNPSPRYFLMGKFFQDRTMWKLRSRGFRKCGTFWACELFNGSYCWSKSDHVGKSRSVTEIRRCSKKKTRPQFWFFRLATESAWAPHGWVHTDSVPGLKNQNCVRVFFFDTAFCFLKKLKNY